MAFDDFKKDDLDFGSLITAEKPKKKFPKSSEGLRFLSRNLKQDVESRYPSNQRSIPRNIEKSLEKDLSPSSSDPVDPHNLSIDKKRTAIQKPSHDHFLFVDKTSTNDLDNDNLISTIDKRSSITPAHDEHNTSIDINRTGANNSHLSSIDDFSATDLPSSVLNDSKIVELESSEILTSVQFETKSKIDPYQHKNNASKINFEGIRSNEKSQSASSNNKNEILTTEPALSNSDDLILSTDETSPSTEPTTDQEMSIDVLSTNDDSKTNEHTTSIDNLSTSNNATNVGHNSSIDINSAIYEESINPLISNTDNRTYASRFKGNFTKLSNHIFKIWNELPKTEKILFTYFYRSSFGWNKNTTNNPISIRFLEKALPLSHNSIPTGIKGLIKRGLLKEIESSNIGTTYQVCINAEGNELEAPITSYYTPLDNNFFELSKKCSTSDMIVYLILYRYSYGFNQNITSQKILTSKLANEVGLSVRRTQDAIRNLLSLNLISRVSDISSNGILYRVYLAQEVIDCELKTDVEFTLQTQQALNTSIDKKRTLNSSTDNIDVNLAKPSIDTTRIPEKKSTESIDNTALASNDPISSTDKNSNKEILNKINTSSGDDEIFLFFEYELKKHPKLVFPISKKKISELIEKYDSDHIKTVFKKCLPLLTKEETQNPVGLFLHAVNNSETYTILNKPSEEELTAKKHYENLIETREKTFSEEYKRIIEKNQKSYWDKLPEDERKNILNKRKQEMGQGKSFSIPERAIEQSAMERTFWEKHNRAWEELPTDDRTARASQVKQSIIKRIYAGEGRAVPNSLPEREFLKFVDEIAEKLAMISSGKLG